MEAQDNSLTIKLNRKDARPNAPRYEIRTIQDLFNTLTEENVDRFLEEFAAGVKATLALRAMVIEIAKASGQEITPDMVPSDCFVWIDDAPIETSTPKVR